MTNYDGAFAALEMTVDKSRIEDETMIVTGKIRGLSIRSDPRPAWGDGVGRMTVNEDNWHAVIALIDKPTVDGRIVTELTWGSDPIPLDELADNFDRKIVGYAHTVWQEGYKIHAAGRIAPPTPETPRERFEAEFGVITDERWQWLKEFLRDNYDCPKRHVEEGSDEDKREAAALYGLAENPALAVEDRVSSALKALAFYSRVQLDDEPPEAIEHLCSDLTVKDGVMEDCHCREYWANG